MLASDLAALTPADDASFVNPADDLIIAFDDGIVSGTGNITIKSGDEVVETIDVTSDAVTIDGQQVIINPTNDLPIDSDLSVEVDAGAFVSTSKSIFSEDFEGVTLIEFEVETDGNDEDTDWSDELPDGWVKDNTDTPEGDPPEFFGFTIFDKESWIAAAGDQGRGSFTRGTGNVVVADGDEYDDGTEIDPDQFNVFLTTPTIPLAEANAQLKFDSSFRPYPTMTGLVDVSFDDGDTWENLLTLNDETVEGGTSSLARANVREVVPLNNEAGAEALVRFGMVDAGNDWWWAVDNVSVEVPGEGEAFEGISGPTSWNFRTSPDLSPENGATAVALDGNLQVTFSKDVRVGPGLGNAEIRRVADGSLFEAIPMASERVTSSGATVTIDPVGTLEANTQYYVAIDDFTIWDTEDVDVTGITLFAEDFEGLELLDSGLVGGLDVNDYVVVMSGVLDVQADGVYTFGGNSDDGQLLAIDLEQDGLDIDDDEIIFDDSTHGTQDRLSTCAFEANDVITSCENDGDPGIELEEGEYAFEYWYFERAGGSSGEFFYAPGTHEIFDAAEFVLVGDDSQGIGLTEDGITATTYLSAVEDEAVDTITTLERARLLVEGTITRADGFPAEATIPTADIWNTGGFGRFNDNHPLPGFEPPEPDQDWTPTPPDGWSLEEDIPEGGAPEFEGWTFQNKDFWIAQQGDQGRTNFSKGQGTVAVSDPDATDDFVDIDPMLYQDVFMITPEIDISDLEPNSVQLEFDSSFRPYDVMAGLVDVSIDGGDWENLLTLVGTGGEGDFPNSSLERVNETVVLNINNPRNGTLQFRWGMDDADNDWWWAVDNIRVTSPFKGNPIDGVKPGEWSFTTGDGSGMPTDNSHAMFGDFDQEGEDGYGVVGFSDFVVLSTHYLEAVEPYTNGDTNGDGQVNFVDFVTLSTNYLEPVPEANAPAAAAADTVFAISATSDADDDDDDDDLVSDLG